MKRFQKILAVALTVCVLGGCFAFAAGAESRKAYLVLGDSIGYGAGIQNPGKANYGRIIANTNGFSYKNNATNGNTTDDMLARLNDASYRADVAEADIISISIGGNDFLQSNVPALIAQGNFNNYEMVDAIVAKFSVNLDGIMTRLRGLNPDALILFQTLYNPMSAPNLKKIYGEAIGRLNNAIRTYLDGHPGIFVLVDVAADMDAKSGQIAGDGIHPNAAGNLTIAQTVQNKLVELGVADSAELTVTDEPENWGTVPKSFWQRILDFFRRIAAFFQNLFAA